MKHNQCAEVCERATLCATCARGLGQKPLTKEEIAALLLLCVDGGSFSPQHFARAIERAHGIGVEK